MERDDRRDVQAREEVQHLHPIGPAVNPELVLDDRDVELVERFNGPLEGGTIAVTMFVYDFRSAVDSWIIHEAHHAQAVVGAALVGNGLAQGSRKGRDPARRGRIGADKPDRNYSGFTANGFSML